MSTIKSSAENLTLNADGANNDIKFQSNGSEVASLDQAGVFTATSFSGGGSTPSIVDGGNATAINIDSSENVGIGHPLSQHQQRLVVKKTAAITSLGGGGGINIVNEQGAGNFANLRFTGSNQNCYLGYRDGANDQDRRFSIGVGADAEHFSFSQAGLKFNGDTAAANALDDYEEGTFTVTSSDSGGSFYSSGHYVKVGGIVHIRAYFGDIAGGVSFAGLPFAAEASTSFAIHQMYQVNWPASAKQLVCYASGSNIVFGWQTDTGTGLSPTSTDTAHSSCTFGIAGTYKTTA